MDLGPVGDAVMEYALAQMSYMQRGYISEFEEMLLESAYHRLGGRGEFASYLVVPDGFFEHDKMRVPVIMEWVQTTLQTVQTRGLEHHLLDAVNALAYASQLKPALAHDVDYLLYGTLEAKEHMRAFCCGLFEANAERLKEVISESLLKP